MRSSINILAHWLFNPFWLFAVTSLHWGAIIGAVGALVSSKVSSDGAKDAAESANDANKEMTDETNRLNQMLFHEGRGSDGHALLPEYFGDTETGLGSDIIDVYGNYVGDTTFGDTTHESLTPAFDQGTDLISDIFSNKVLDERSKDLAAISSARRQGIQQGLSERLVAVDSRRKAAGLGGGSSVANRLMLGDTVEARQAAGLADATDIKAINDENLNLKLGLLDAPMTRAQAAYAFGYQPDTAAYQPIDQLLQRLSFFNMGEGNQYSAQTPTLQTVPSAGQFLGPAIGQTAGAAANYYNSYKANDRPSTINVNGSTATYNENNDSYSVPSSFFDTYGGDGDGGGG